MLFRRRKEPRCLDLTLDLTKELCPEIDGKMRRLSVVDRECCWVEAQRLGESKRPPIPLSTYRSTTLRGILLGLDLAVLGAALWVDSR